MSHKPQWQPGRVGEGTTGLVHGYGSNGIAAFLGTQNLAGMSSTFCEAVSETSRVAILKYGHDTATKAQAAAHEAGHVIVATAIGEIITAARLTKHRAMGRTVWLGSNHRICPGSELDRYFNIANEPMAALRIAINSVAGFFGEMQVRLNHPSSSIDERYKTTVICAELDRVWGKPDELTAALVGFVVRTSLETNIPRFDAIRAHLTRTGRLTQGEAKRLLESVIPFDLEDAVKEFVR